MTDDLPQLVQRLDLPWQCKSFDPEGGTECHERHRGDIEAWCSACIVNQLAAALDTLTRALAEQQEAHRREGNEWVEAMFNTTTEMDRLREALAAMTQERDEARALAGRQSVALTELGDKCSDEFNRAESATAAAREARAETWASAIGAVEALGESGFFNYAKEQLKAARTGQP